MHLRLFNSNWMGIYLKRIVCKLNHFLFQCMFLFVLGTVFAEIEIPTFDSRLWNGPVNCRVNVIEKERVYWVETTMILAIFVFHSIEFPFYPWIPIDRIAFVSILRWPTEFTQRNEIDCRYLVSTIPYQIALLFLWAME